MTPLAQKRMVVTGGGGFLGRHLVRKLQEQGYKNVIVPRRREYDLTTESAVGRLYRDAQPEIVIHLAAVVGGIGANRANPGRFFYDNVMMGALLMDYARRSQVEKFVSIGTICSYPKLTPVPFKEESLWDGYPEETNAPYGIAKKMLLVQGDAYRQQYGFKSIFLLPVNLYGPGDNFDAVSSHVIPALIRKCLEAVDAGLPEIVCWGDGAATREFLYVEDCAEAIMLATERYEDREPVNVGAGFEISIQELAELVAELTGFTGRLSWDTSQPGGQPRRSLDTSRAFERFGFKARTSLRDGLDAAIEWYLQNRNLL